MAEKKKLSLEAAMTRLEEIVAAMENDKLPLTLFLCKDCNSAIFLLNTTLL